MSRQETIRRELGEIEAIQFVAGALTEIAAKRIKEARDIFRQGRPFYDELRALYALVKSTALKVNAELQKETNGKTLMVAITSNHRFYGALNRDVINAVFEGKKYMETDLLVIGRIGTFLLRERGLDEDKEDVKSMIFQRDIPDIPEMRRLTEHIALYERVLFYYPQFITILSQHIATVDLLELVAEAPVHEGNLTHIFEPELSKMVVFFETEIRKFLVSRVLREAELSRTAVRLVTMSRAEQEAQNIFRRENAALNKMLAELQNMRLLETFAGIIKWKHKLYE